MMWSSYLLQITNVIKEKILRHEVRFGIILSCFMYSLSKEWDDKARSIICDRLMGTLRNNDGDGKENVKKQ